MKAAARQLVDDATAVMALLGDDDWGRPARPVVRDLIAVAGDAERIADEAVTLAGRFEQGGGNATTTPAPPTTTTTTTAPAPAQGGVPQVAVKPKGAPETGGGSES